MNKIKIYAANSCCIKKNIVTLWQTIKHTNMTRNITIKNPSQKMIQVFDALREKKQQQIKKLTEKNECTFTIVV